MKKSMYEQQENMVCKNNDIIRKSRFSLSVQQNKMLLYLISQIKPTDDVDTVYEISLRDFCRVCGIQADSGKNVKDAKKAIQQIADKSIWVRQQNESEILIRWFNRIRLNKRTGRFEVTFHEDMLPYLYDLRYNYVQYKLKNVLVMKSQYSIRLYELLKSYQFMEKEIEFTVEELKIRLNAQKYERYTDFRRYVLEPAVADINKASDICVRYETYKGGERGVKGIWFRIEEPNIYDRIARRAIANQKLADKAKKRENKTDEKANCPEGTK